MTATHKTPAAAYLDYLNNYLTAERFAEAHGLTRSAAIELINEGRQEHENQF